MFYSIEFTKNGSSKIYAKQIQWVVFIVAFKTLVHDQVRLNNS